MRRCYCHHSEHIDNSTTCMMVHPHPHEDPRCIEACNAHDALVRERDGMREALKDVMREAQSRLEEADDPEFQAVLDKCKAAIAAAEGE